jgi:hypothetical protein
MPSVLSVAWWYPQDAPGALIGIWSQFGFKV